MKNVKFISCRETPEGYLLRETSTGVVLEKYHTTKKDGTRSWTLKEFLNKVLWRDLDEVIRLTRAIIGNDCQLFVDNDSVAITEMMRITTAKSVLAGAVFCACLLFAICLFLALVV